MRKICVVTGSRAEYGILRGLMKAIKDDPELQLQIIATNQHLSKLQGETYKEIERDGFTIDYKVYMAMMRHLIMPIPQQSQSAGE